MADHAIVSAPPTFPALVAAVRETLVAGQAHVDRAYLETYRQTGLLIEAHLLKFKDRANYGEQVIPRLAHELGMNERLLYRCLKFVRAYPILTTRSELSWSHYRMLIEVSDAKQRQTLEIEARKNHWSVVELEQRVRAINAIAVTPAGGESVTQKPAHQPLVPQRGTPGIYRVVNIDGLLVVDLGFASYFDLSEEQVKGVKEGDFVRLSASGQVSPAEGATKADLFTYHVELLKVVDGDTFWIKIYLRPRQWIKHKLRLRGLDCPEMSTPEGRAAKRFVDGLVAKATSVVINTTKPDKYDRYLADVFLQTNASEEIFLNNTLLENGQAVRKDVWEFGDWEPDLLK